MLSFRFHDPWWLLLFVVLAGIVYAYLRRRRSTSSRIFGRFDTHVIASDICCDGAVNICRG